MFKMEEKLAEYRRMKAARAKHTYGNTVNISDDHPKARPHQSESIGLCQDNQRQSRQRETYINDNNLHHEGIFYSSRWLLTLKFLLWICLFAFFVQIEFGSVFFIISMLYIVYNSMTTGSRRKNELSAYSVFNRDCERLDGTLTAEQFESELKYGAGPRPST